ncbi:ribonuclease III C terminal domain-containing protein [Phanerochaete sordida]|uniref:Ribonuclease III C terminal domain-containing protein n=1 Tax=Phanerochaete sordida TaxID=48140 RepID=A0A9P3GPN0_9APHY|nr:ribonuclease III C terminal domain-containing protein [Phanerochaete sordida]
MPTQEQDLQKARSRFLQDVLNRTISAHPSKVPSHTLKALLPTRLWRRLFTNTDLQRRENDRNEALGDAILALLEALQIFYEFEAAGLHRMDEICHILHSNETYARLLQHMSSSDPDLKEFIRGKSIKGVADTFETIACLSYLENGWEETEAWFREFNRPLIRAALEARARAPTNLEFQSWAVEKKRKSSVAWAKRVEAGEKRSGHRPYLGYITDLRQKLKRG